MAKKKYDVLLIQPVLVKVKGIDAANKQDAIKKAEEMVWSGEIGGTCPLRRLLDNHEGRGPIAYTEVEENGFLYYLVDEYEGELFGDDVGEDSACYGPDGVTVLDWNHEEGIDDPLGEWRRNHDRSNPWSIDRVQFARLLAELAAAGLTKKQMKALRESMGLEDKDINEILDRAQVQFERDKKEFCAGPEDRIERPV